MNISTYEARIKALEDQLNPPGPGGSTGLLSVTVSPDITLEGGTSLNAKLAELMPIAVGEERSVTGFAPVTNGTEYAVTITPSSELYAFGPNDITGGKGETVTQTVQIADNSFRYGFGAAESENIEDSNTTAYINVAVSKK